MPFTHATQQTTYSYKTHCNLEKSRINGVCKHSFKLFDMIRVSLLGKYLVNLYLRSDFLTRAGSWRNSSRSRSSPRSCSSRTGGPTCSRATWRTRRPPSPGSKKNWNRETTDKYINDVISVQFYSQLFLE